MPIDPTIAELFPKIGEEYTMPDGRRGTLIPMRPAKVGDDSPQGGAFSRGILNVQSDFANTGGLLADLTGFDKTAQKLYDAGYSYSQEAGNIQRRVGRVEDINGAGDVAVFAAETLLENLPMLATLLFSGGVLGTGAKILGAGTKYAKAAGYTGAFLSDVGLMTGESVGIAQDANKDPKDMRVIGSGVGKAALDFIPIGLIAGRLGGRLKGNFLSLFEKGVTKDLVKRGYLRRAGGDIATIISTEVPTEVMQEVLNINLDRSLREVAAGTDLTEEEVSQLKNAAAGATAFGLLGFGTGIIDNNGQGAGREASLLEDEASRLSTNALPAPQLALPHPQGKLAGPEEPLALPAPDGRTSFPDFPHPTAPKLLESPERQLETELKAAEQGATPQEALRADVEIDPMLIPPEAGEKVDGQHTPQPGDPQAVLSDHGGTINATPEVKSWNPKTQSWETVSDPEPIAASSIVLEMVSPETLTQTEGAQVAINNSRKAAVSRNSQEGTRVKIPIPVGVEKLIEQLNALYASESSYRKDGELKAGIRRKIESREKRIRNLYERAGIKSELAAEILPSPKSFDEAQGQVQEQSKRNLEPTHTALSDRESAYLESLREKEQGPQGLTAKEYEDYERLESKAEGEVATERRKPTEKDNRDLLNDDGSTLSETNVGDSVRPKPWYSKGVSEDAVARAARAAGQTYVPMNDRVQILRSMLKQLWRESGVSPDKTYVITEAQAGSLPPNIRGVAKEAIAAYDPLTNSTIYVANKIPTIEEMFKTILHETTGHFGLRAYLDPATLHAVKNSVLEGQRAKVMQRYKETHGISRTSWINKLLAREIMHPDLGVENYRGETWTQYINERDDHSLVLDREIGRVTMARNNEMVDGWEAETAGSWHETKKDAMDAELDAVELIAAEEYIANMAETQPNASLVRRVIARIKRHLATKFPSIKMTDADIRALLMDTRAFLKEGTNAKSKVNQHVEQLLEEVNPGLLYRRNAEPNLGGEPRQQESPVESANALWKVWRMQIGTKLLSPLQIAERFPTLPGTKYLELVQKWWARKRILTNIPTEIADEINSLGKKEYRAITDAVYAIEQKSAELGRKLQPGELQTIFRETGVDRTGQELWQRMDESFRSVINEMQTGLEVQTIRHAYGRNVSDGKIKRVQQLWRDANEQGVNGMKAFNTLINQDTGNLELIGRLNTIRTEMEKMRNRNYFPHMRFGRWAATWKDSNGKTHHFETFASYKEREDAIERINRAYGNQYSVQRARVSDEEFSFLAMPPAMYDILQKDLGLTGEQQMKLREIFYLRSPGRAFLRHLTRRKGTAGFSRDLLRVYTTYMQNSANHIARIEYHQQMQDQIAELGELRKTSQYADRLTVLYDYFVNHFDYLMNPGNDLAKWRAYGFLWYLGFNVKSAAVNLTQIPMVAYPFLASRHGDKAAVGAIARAYKTITRYKTGKQIDPGLLKDLDRAIREGFVDESQATTLAGYAEESTLQRLITTNAADKAVNDLSYYGAFLFQHAEKFNREVTFTAARELALQSGATPEEAFRAGRKAVQSSMFEYAKWNRAAFMRGKKSIFFLFWQYMQSLSFIAYGGEGKGAAMRVWGMLLLAAGFQGLPFMENILDILDFGSTKAKEAFGMNDPKTDLRTELRELASTVTDNPDLFMHGLSRSYGLGPMHLLELLGADIPHTDLSGSISAGRVIPGTQDFLSSERDPNAKLGRTISEVMGPVLGVPYTFWKAMESDDPNRWKVWERALPVVLQQASKAARRGVEGEETFRGGGAIAKFDPHNTEHRLELLSQALGFSTTRLNQKYELRNAQETLRRYWAVRRTMVLENYAYALMAEDKETLDAAKKAITRFNKAIPAPGGRIDNSTLKKSIEQRYQRATLREQGIPREDFFIEDFLRKKELYPSAP